MGAKNKRGVWVPTAGDDLLQSWQTMAQQLGVHIPVASTSAARAVLDQAQAAGMGATTSNPIVFIVGSTAQKIMYAADGTKQNSRWVLEPINEVEVAENTTTTTSLSGIVQFQMKTIIKSTLATAPYDRVVMATGHSYGQVTAGRVNLGLRIGSSADQPEARFSAEWGSAAVSNIGIIRANTAPNIVLGAVGDHPSVSSAVSVGAVEKHNNLGVIAFPITMAV